MIVLPVTRHTTGADSGPSIYFGNSEYDRPGVRAWLAGLGLLGPPYHLPHFLGAGHAGLTWSPAAATLHGRPLVISGRTSVGGRPIHFLGETV